MREPEKDDFLRFGVEREIRLYLSYAESNVVRTKVAQILDDRAAVSRLKPIEGGWAFMIHRTGGDAALSEIASRQETSDSS